MNSGVKIAIATALLVILLASGCIEPQPITPQPRCGDGECNESEAVLDWNGDVISTTCAADCGSCDDSDGGIDYYSAGSTTDFLGASVSDACIGDVLVEGICHNNEARSLTKDCELGCSGNACVGDGALLAEGEYCSYSDENGTAAAAIGERICSPYDERIYTCDTNAKWAESEDCAARDPARICWQGTCVLPSSPEILWMEFDECSGTTAFDTTANANNGNFLTYDIVPPPSWTTDRTGNGCALSFTPTSGLVMVRDTAVLNGRGSNIEDTLTLEAWVKPDSATTGWKWIAVKTWSFYLLQKGKDVKFSIGLDGAYDRWLNTGYAPLIGLRTWSHPIEIGQWNHIAATYSAATREMKLYVNGELEAQRAIPQEYINLWFNSASTEEGSLKPLWISGPGWHRAQGYPGAIDDVRIYDYVKTCFDITDNGVDDCATCKPETITLSAANAMLGEEAKCPAAGTTETENSLGAFVVEPATGLFENEVADGSELCIAEPISITYSKLGTYPVTEPALTRNCNEQCFKECTHSCVDNYFEDCTTDCTHLCSNGVCLGGPGVEICGGVGGLDTNYCQDYYLHTATGVCTVDADCDPGWYCHPTATWCWTRITDCYIMSLDPACNYCTSQCAPSNFDTSANTVTYDKACGFEVNEVLEFRKTSCTGQLVSTYPLTGIGSESITINAPSKPGNHVLCFNGTQIWSGNVKTEGCPMQLGCVMMADDTTLTVSKDQKNSVQKINLTLTNIKDTSPGKQYSYSMYSKVEVDETYDTATGVIPDYITLDPMASTGAPIGLDETTTLKVNINVAQMQPKLKNCYMEKGNEEQCERERFETSDPNRMPSYENIIVRAEATGIEGYYCEMPVSVSLVDVCTPETQVCDGVDDDCDGIVDECIVEVEATRPIMLEDSSVGTCTADPDCPTGFTCQSGECKPGSCTHNNDCPTDPHGFKCIDGQCTTKAPGGSEPLPGLTIGFYSRACAESNGLQWSNWQDFPAIIAACAPTGTCDTDAEGYCSTEIPGGVQYTAIGVLDDGGTQKQLGVPVAQCPCGHEKKVWHLAYKTD